MDGRVDGWMNALLNLLSAERQKGGWLGGWVDGWMDGWMRH